MINTETYNAPNRSKKIYCYSFRQPSHVQSGSAKFNEAFSAFRRKIKLMLVTGNLGKKGDEIYREMTE